MSLVAVFGLCESLPGQALHRPNFLLVSENVDEFRCFAGRVFGIPLFLQLAGAPQVQL